MNSAHSAGSEYDARIRRAETLIAGKSSASEILAFHCRVASFQKNLQQQVGGKLRAGNEWNRFASVREALDLKVLLPHFRGFLALIEGTGPKPLAEAAREFAARPSDAWKAALTQYWESGGLPNRPADPFAQFFPRAFVEPCAAHVAGQMAEPPILETPRVCPLCGGQPMIGVLRQEGDGGRRCMICSFCSHEWSFRRILCPACGEQDEKKLPVYVAEEFPHIRVEACDTCKFFARTIDLTKDGHAIPVVDDLAAIPLTLWAHEHGFSRLQPNLLGS